MNVPELLLYQLLQTHKVELNLKDQPVKGGYIGVNKLPTSPKPSQCGIQKKGIREDEAAEEMKLVVIYW